MIFDNKPLREIAEADVRRIVDAGLAEHLYLEYKAELYPNNHAGKREFLQDICMFANAQGGVLLIGIPERRDANNQATGVPDPGAPLGIEVENPEQVLLSCGARVESSIEERLRIESHAIPVADNRFVLAFRVPNSTAKPHSVSFEGHLSFPVRRERHKGNLDVREMKEMVMRTASQLERADNLLKYSLANEPRLEDAAVLLIGVVPIFYSDFMVEIANQATHDAFGRFHIRTGLANFFNPQYSFDGLTRSTANGNDVSKLGRNGLIRSRLALSRMIAARDALLFRILDVDRLLRNFVTRTADLCHSLNFAGPLLLRASLHTPRPLQPMDRDGLPEGEPILAGYWEAPTIQISNIGDAWEKSARPLCDFFHQMFGFRRSPYFDGLGGWVGPQ
ncbi:MAG: ATP-binding protein [Acidobacteriales bacterium]|nr:ATP-binding protein [Terriglobales bacterium]